MNNNIEQIKEMENIVNDYLESLKIEDLFSTEFIKKYVRDERFGNILLDESYVEKYLYQLDENDIRKLDKLVKDKTSFINFDTMKKSAKEYLIAKKLKELSLI